MQYTLTHPPTKQMAHIVCQPNLLSSPISSSSSSSSTAVGAASKWCYPVVSLSNLRSFPTRLRCVASPGSQMEPQCDERPRFKDFPYASAPIRDLMVEVLSMVESRLSSQLLPYALSPDVEYYRDESGTQHGSLYILRGAHSSQVDFLIGSWQRRKLPKGETYFNTSSLTCYMKDTTDAPPLMMEFMEFSPTTLLITLDLPPRRDLLLHINYLNTFYEDTELDEQRELILDDVPEAAVVVVPSIDFRCFHSPTAIKAWVETSDGNGGGEARLEEIVRENVSVAAREVVETWLEVCACGEKRELKDRASLKKRDAMFKCMTFGVEFECALADMFGEEVGNRVWAELRLLGDTRGELDW